MARTITAALLACCAAAGVAAPFVPTDDAQVLERLPERTFSAAARELRGLRDAWRKAPHDPAAASALARRYFDLASAEGDPRWSGRAEAVLAPWWKAADPPDELRLLRALLRQFRHEFDAAFVDLDALLARDPAHLEARFWRFALLLVGARYAEARIECDRMKAAEATRLTVLACRATVDSLTGRARAAHDALADLLEAEPPRSADFRLWVLTRLAEMAQRAGDPREAERHFRAALADLDSRGAADFFVLAAYADLLLDQGRNAEVMKLLVGGDQRRGEQNDVLLARLAIAAKRAGHPDAARHAQMLKSRFADASRRGDRLHLQDESRLTLALDGDAQRAARLALENWKTQREPRDARVLMEAALAARDPSLALPALEWLRRSGFEDPIWKRLERELAALPGAAR